ncbi:MAG: physarolisin [Pseudonocardiales bacterium]|nr:physarolisin [Pseudonocardiales bacterium]
MRFRVIATLATASVLAVSGIAGTTAAQAAPTRVVLAKSTPSWLARASQVGKTAADAPVIFRVYLAPNGGLDNLAAAVAKVSTPGSASYRKFITTATYHAAYDPTAATVASVSSWLASQHLKVTGVADYNAYIQAAGSVADVQAAFGTSISTYNYEGKTATANSSALSVPDGVAGAVLSVTGIDSLPKLNKPANTTPVPPSASYVNARPCSLYYGQVTANLQADYATPLPTLNGKALPYSVCGYTGVQYRSAYEGPTSLNGAGVTVGIIDAFASPTIAQDISQYANTHGDGGYVTKQFTQNNYSTYTHTDDSATGCGASGWFGEETLDIEAVHAMAPAANIRYYGAKSCYDDDIQNALAKVVNENRVDLVTNSYGEPDEIVSGAGIAAFEAVVLQGSLQGISFMFSSGDNGDELANTGLKQTDSSASDPYVTAVGGTADAIGSDGKFIFQTGWGTQKYSLAANGKTWSPLGYLYGAGGGYSTLFNRPAYQNGVVPTNAPAGRAVPDVAMDADPTTGMLVGQTQTFPNGEARYGEYRIGGTSLASPLFTGMTALLLQHAGGRLGFLNPLIYGQAKAKTFNDVKGAPADAGNVRADYANANDPSGGILYSIRTFNQDSSLPVKTGWDAVTGIGAPNPAWLTTVIPAAAAA